MVEIFVWIVILLAIAVLAAIVYAYEMAYALLGGQGILVLTIILVTLVVTIMRYFKHKKSSNQAAFENSEYVRQAMDFVRFIDETVEGSFGVYCGSEFIACYVPEYNHDVEIGIRIRGYLERRREKWGENELRHYLMQSFADYLGSSEALEKFASLNLDADLINGDIEKALIKMPLVMPEYERDKDKYIEALQSRCKTQFVKAVSVQSAENLSFMK